MHIEQQQNMLERELSNVTVAVGMRQYLARVLHEPENPALQQSPFTRIPWGEALGQFTRDLEVRLGKAQNFDELAGVISPLVTRGIELVSGGVVSKEELEEGERRGLRRNGTWPDVPGGHFWNPRDFKEEQRIIQGILPEILGLSTNSSVEHIGRVITMSLPALLSWMDIRGKLTSKEEVLETIQRLLDAEQTGSVSLVTFGCEPYEYEFAPNTTTTHLRRSRFGNEISLRTDAMHGSFRAVRRILEPLQLSGLDVSYDFYTSYGSSWELIQRQVMPDTSNWYRENSSPEEMLHVLQRWRNTIQAIGEEEFEGTGIVFNTREMEQKVVLPALERLAEVLQASGMTMPVDKGEFIYGSESWFAAHAYELKLLQSVFAHSDPELLVGFLLNEEQWSRKHPEAYVSDEQRKIQAALLSLFEFEQYSRIYEIINSSDIALGVEIDEELISLIRNRAKDRGEEQTPLLWGRPPRFTQEGRIGGVAHRQPWFYAEQ